MRLTTGNVGFESDKALVAVWGHRTVVVFGQIQDEGEIPPAGLACQASVSCQTIISGVAKEPWGPKADLLHCAMFFGCLTLQKRVFCKLIYLIGEG